MMAQPFSNIDWQLNDGIFRPDGHAADAVKVCFATSSTITDYGLG